MLKKMYIINYTIEMILSKHFNIEVTMKDLKVSFIASLLLGIGSIAISILPFLAEAYWVGVIFILCGIYILYGYTYNNYKELKKYYSRSSSNTQSQNSTTETRVNDQLQHTIQHFKDFFRKFGVTLSPEEVAHIMTQYAIAKSEGNSDEILFQYIPDEIPSPNKFINETTYQFNYLLSICSDEIIKQRILNEWNSTIDEFTPFAVCGIYETQKLTVKEEEQYLFRFNYELNAIIMLLTYCEDISEEATEDEENTINAFTDALLKYANSAGYSALN